MTTKLDDLVNYLAGRDGDPKLLDELADPASEASRFLESTRARSRALIADPVVDAGLSRSNPRGWSSILTIIVVALIATIAIGALVESRFRRLEELQARRYDNTIEHILSIDSKLFSDAEHQSVKVGFGRLEAGIDKLEHRLEALERPPATPHVDPMIVELHDGLTALRRELSIIEKGSARQSEDLRVANLEIARLLRLLVSRSLPTTPPAEPEPEFPKPRRP